VLSLSLTKANGSPATPVSDNRNSFEMTGAFWTALSVRAFTDKGADREVVELIEHRLPNTPNTTF
jgi:hypothetical protein